MISSKTGPVAYGPRFAWLAAIALVISSGAAEFLNAQSQPSVFDKLTPEYLVGSAVSLSNKSYPDIEKAIQRFRNNDGSGAFDFLKKASEKDPKLPPAELIFAKMHLALRNANSSRIAHIFLERTVVEHPEDPEAYLLLADQAFSGGRTTEAQAMFEYVAPMVSKFAANEKRKKNFTIRVLAGRAAIAERRTKWEVAQEWLQKWVEVDPDSAAAHQRLGVTLFRLDKAGSALAEFNKARELNEKIAHPYILLGQLFSGDDDQENAKKAYAKAYAEDSENPATAQAYTNWLIQQGELDQARTIVSAAREKNPDSKSAVLLEGVVAVMQGQRDQGRQIIEKVLTLDPSNFLARNLLALLLIESDDKADQERALSHAKVNADRFSDNPQANITLGWVLHRLGREAESQESLKKITGVQIPADSAYLVARMLVDRGNDSGARQTLERIPPNSRTLFIFRRDAEALLAKLKGE